MPPLKNIRHENFCQEYLKDSNGSRSVIAAGYHPKQWKDGSTSSSVQAHNLLKTAKVQQRMVELRAQHARRWDVSRDWVVKRLRVNVGRALQAIPVLDNKGHRTGEYTYQGAVANKSLELLGRDIGMWPDKQEIKTGDTYNLTQYNFTMPTNGREHAPIGNGHAHGNGSAD